MTKTLQFPQKESIDSEYNWGKVYLGGIGVPKDHQEAAKRFRVASEQGHTAAQYNLGVLCAGGRGVPKDSKEAVKWLKIASEKGNATAKKQLQEIFKQDLTTSRRDDLQKYHQTSYTELLRLAKQGDFNAQYYLGNFFEDGQEIPQNHQEAIHWFQLAAKQSDAKAQYSLGNICFYGRGLEQDYNEAIRWWKLAAEQGHPDAQFNLGSIYYNGQGVEQNDQEAVQWFQMAAKQGDAKAQYTLRVMYYEGRGVSKDFLEDSNWWTTLIADQEDEIHTISRDEQDVKWTSFKIFWRYLLLILVVMPYIWFMESVVGSITTTTHWEKCIKKARTS